MSNPHSAGRHRLSAISIGLLLVAGIPTPAHADAHMSIQSYTGHPVNDARFTADNDPDRTSAQFEVTGTLRSQDGATLGLNRVAVSLDPGPKMLVASLTQEDAATGLTLASTQTDKDGRFTLTIPALKDIDSYVDDDGLVSLLFVGIDDSGLNLMYRQQTRLPSQPGTPARAKFADDAVLPPVETKDPALTDVRGQATESVLTGLNLTASLSKSGKTSRLRGMDPMQECTRAWNGAPILKYRWDREGGAMRKWVTVQHAQTRKKSTMKYEWSNTKETAVQTVVEITAKGSGATGGYAKSTVTGAGLNFNVPNSWRGNLDAEFDFYHWGLWCNMSGDLTAWRAADVHEIRPYQFKGFSQIDVPGVTYKCNRSAFRGSLGNEMWVSRANTVTTSLSVWGGLDGNGIGGKVQFDSKQVNTGAHKATYTPTAAGAKICGQDKNPAATEKVMEIDG